MTLNPTLVPNTPPPLLLLAQGPLNIPEPAPLPGAPFLTGVLLESPWPMVLLLGITAGLVWILYSNRGQIRKARAGAAILLAAAVGVFLLARLVTTDREAVRQIARQLVRDVAAANVPGVRGALAQECELLLSATAPAMDANDILERVERDFSSRGPYRVKDYGILETQSATYPDGLASVQIKVRVTAESGGILLSWWRLDFRGEAGGWRVTRIRMLSNSAGSAAGLP